MGGEVTKFNLLQMSIASSSSSFWGRCGGDEIESGGDPWMVRVINCNVLY